MDTRKIITIYENDSNVKDIVDVLKLGMKKRITKPTATQHRFLSNRSLLGVQQNTRELTRIMNKTKHEHFKETHELAKTMSSTNQRPQTTQCFNRKSQIKKRRSNNRPMTQNQGNSTINYFPHRMSIFEQNKLLPSYQNLTVEDTSEAKGRCKSSAATKKTRSRKPVSSEKSYKELKNKIIEKMKVDKQNPNVLNEN